MNAFLEEWREKMLELQVSFETMKARVDETLHYVHWEGDIHVSPVLITRVNMSRRLGQRVEE